MDKVKPRIGLYICDHGDRLSKSLDLEALVKKISKNKSVGQIEVVKDLWAENFLESVKKDWTDGKINRFLWVGRFSQRQVRFQKETLHLFGVNAHLHHWLDLEEQGIRSNGADQKILDKKALTLLKMAIAKTRFLEPLEPEVISASDTLLILGGGVAGLHTAASVASLGKSVHIVEKESGVGGKVAGLSRFYPRICDPHCGLEFITDQLSQAEKVTFHTLSELSALEGSPGNFMARIRKRPRYVDEARCNGCGECEKACPVEVSEPPAFIELREPGEAAGIGDGNILRITHKAIHPARPMAFPTAFTVDRDLCSPECRECEKACPSHAVELDQTDREEEIRAGAVLVTTGWEPYPLSKVEEYGYGRYPNVVSNLEMERLLSLGDQIPNADPAFSLDRLNEVGFIQCVGSRDERHLSYCSSVCCSATIKQILHFKEKVPDAHCHVFFMHIRTTGFEEELYRRVRELGGVDFIKDRPARIESDEETGKINVTVLDPVLDKKLSMKLDLLVLAGGMCPSSESQDLSEKLGLPKNDHSFFESHLQCFPEESQRTGIFVGGCAREPMNVGQSIESAHRGAMKALSFLQGSITIEPNYPILDKTKCDQCKRCMEDCPFSAYVFDEKEFPLPVLEKCRQCGNCMGVCPLQAISIRNNTIRQAAAQIQILENSFMGPKEPLVLAFLCENDAYKAARAAVDQGLPVPPNVVFMPVNCAGNINNALLADALSLGVDGVFIGGCRDGHCHYVWGNQLVEKRSGDLSDKLKTMMIEPERVRFEHIEIRDSHRYTELLQSYIEDLKAMGPNPFKI